MKKILSIVVIFTFMLVLGCAMQTSKQISLIGQDEDIVSGDIDGETDSEQLEGNVKVAVLLPLSGKAKKIGNILLESAQVALFELRKSNIELLPYDTKGTSFGALNAIKQAAADDVDVVLGPLFSSSTKAVIEVAKLNNLAVLSFSNNQALMNNQNVYLMGFTPEQEIERIVNYSLAEGKYGFAALLPNDKYGAAVSKVLKDTVARKNGKVVKIEYYFKDDTSIESKVKSVLSSYAIPDRIYEEYEQEKELNKAKVKEEQVKVEFVVNEEDKIYPDTILITDTGKRIAKIVQTINENKKEGTEYQLIGNGKWNNDLILSNSELIGGWFVAPDPDDYKELERKFYGTYGRFPIRIASLSYDAVMIVNEIFNKRQTDTRQAVIDNLEDYKGFYGIDGPIRFLPNGLVERRFCILEVEEDGVSVIDKSLKDFLDY